MERVSDFQSIPNQNFKLSIGDYVYELHIFYCDRFIAYDLSIDDVEIVTGYRLFSGQPLIPYEYQEVDGNFILDTPRGEDPDYTKFGDTQYLLYLNQDESDEVRSFLNGNS